ncbi:cytochrome P450, partial [Aulographum hederae CBS 113979]
PILRTGPSSISVASVEGLRIVYVGAFDKDGSYNDFRNFGGWFRGLFGEKGRSVRNMMSTLAHAPHRERKKMLSKVYSKSYLAHSSDMALISRVLVNERLLPMLRRAIEARQELVDVFELNLAVGQDFITAFLLGLEDSSDLIGDEKERITIEREFLTVCEKVLRKEDEKRKITDEKEAKRDSMSPENSGEPVVFQQMYEKLAPLGSMSGPEKNLLPTIASELLDHIGAGRDTIAITLTYAMYELSRRPALQGCLHEELRTLKQHACHPGNSLPSPSSINALPLLHAISPETLRLYPPSPNPQSRVVPAGGVELHSFLVPPGTIISSAPYVLHMNPAIFRSPKEYNPLRWLPKSSSGCSTSSELAAKRARFWPFSSGERKCIGSHFAEQIVKLVLVAMYSNSKTAVEDDTGIEPIDSNLGFPKGRKLVLRFENVEKEKVGFAVVDKPKT